MSNLEKRAHAIERINAIRQTAHDLQTEVFAIATELSETGLPGEQIMMETGIQLINLEAAASQAKSAS